MVGTVSWAELDDWLVRCTPEWLDCQLVELDYWLDRMQCTAIYIGGWVYRVRGERFTDHY